MSFKLKRKDPNQITCIHCTKSLNKLQDAWVQIKNIDRSVIITHTPNKKPVTKMKQYSEIDTPLCTACAHEVEKIIQEAYAIKKQMSL
jgi:hypothetical protein